jgi:hypothetical protein
MKGSLFQRYNRLDSSQKHTPRNSLHRITVQKLKQRKNRLLMKSTGKESHEISPFPIPGLDGEYVRNRLMSNTFDLSKLTPMSNAFTSKFSEPNINSTKNIRRRSKMWGSPSTKSRRLRLNTPSSNGKI